MNIGVMKAIISLRS